MENHKLKVNETHKRSLLKGISMRIFEITIYMLLLFMLGLEIEKSLVVSVGIEGLCFAVYYMNERMWNRIGWGRRVG